LRQAQPALQFRRDYWDDERARSAFMRFLQRIHGLDLTVWLEAGCGDFDDYHPFSLFDEAGEVIASTCLFSMDAVVGGRVCRAAQLSGVGTLPEHRRRGLNGELTRRAIEWAGSDHELLFLFADDEARSFYAGCGFTPFGEQEPSLLVEGRRPREGMRELDLGSPADRALLEGYAADRCPLSSTLSAHNPKLLLFHALYLYAAGAHHVPGLDVVLFLDREGPRLTIADVIGERMPPLSELLPFVLDEDTREVAFGFVPDLLTPQELRWRPISGNNCHVRGELALPEGPLLFPATAHA
jgi:GNAT superfamily N-acetyltransferase